MLMVHHFLEHSARRVPCKVAVVSESQRLTYAELDAAANRLANALLKQGVVRGDRVVLWLPNNIEAAVGIFAVLKAGGVFVMANTSTKPDKLTRMIHDCRAAAIVAPTRYGDAAAAVMADAESVRLIILTGDADAKSAEQQAGVLRYDDIQQNASANPPASAAIDQDLACLIYTSGSSGEPKGVMSSHANVVFAAWSICTYLENASEDVIISALPLSFDYGLYQLIMSVRVGATLVLERSFAYPVQFLQRLVAERATGFPGVPTMFALLLQMDLSGYDLSSLRYLTNTGAALPPSHILRLQQAVPHARLYSMYGLTETKRTLYLPPEQLARRPDSVGIPIPGTEAWLVDERDQRLGPNQIGELVVRGRHVMRGYWEKPEATAQRYRPGSLPGETLCYTGDLFRMDEEGYFYFVGRQDDIIKSRGEKVAPKEVENRLYALDGVAEAAVIGVPDPILGQAVKAFVVTQNGALSAADVQRHCRAHLEDFMVPKYVEFVDELPKTTSGKIRKTTLT